MEIPVSKANAQLDDLVRRAQAGEEVVLTFEGRPAVKLVPVEPAVEPRVNKEARMALLREIMASGAEKALPGPSAARGQDFLYDEYGLPK